MHRLDEHGHDRIDRYLRGRLEGEEREAFELRLLEDEDFFDEVRRAEAMHEAFQAEKAVAGKPPGQVNPSRAFNHWLRHPLSMAAGLALCFSLAFNVYLGGRAEDGMSGILPVNSFVVLETLRGGSGALRVEGPAPYLVQIDVGLLPASLFEVRLIDGGGRLIFQEAGLSARDGWLRVLISDPLSGLHTLEIMGTEIAQAYTLSFSG